MSAQDGVTFGQLEREVPEKYDIFIPENSPFKEAGSYTVNLPKGGNGARYINIQVRQDGGFSILNDTVVNPAKNHSASGNADDDMNKSDNTTYEQLVHENIDPELGVSYFQHYYHGELVGIIELGDCKDRPYMMKKDYGDKLKKGNCFIRKGSHQMLAARIDLEKIYEERRVLTKFDKKLRVFFSYSDLQEKELKTRAQTLKNVEWPSDRAAKEIQSVITKKQESLDAKKNSLSFGNLISEGILELPSIGNVPYENRSIETLKKKDNSRTGE